MDTSNQPGSGGYYSPDQQMNNNGINNYVPHVPPGRNRQPMLPQDPNSGHHDLGSIQPQFLVDRNGNSSPIRDSPDGYLK